MLMTESFDQNWKLVKFVNDNKIKKENIISITVIPTNNLYYEYILFYFDNSISD